MSLPTCLLYRKVLHLKRPRDYVSFNSEMMNEQERACNTSYIYSLVNDSW